MKRRTKSLKTPAGDLQKADRVTAATVSQPKSQPPTPEQIQQRAYGIFEARGGAPGQELQDWLQAERELKAGLARLPKKAPARPQKPSSPQV